MKLLVITQKVDINDPVLGFFHEWIRSLAPSFEKISVICLEKGDYTLPSNVKVYSLGKETGRNRLKYISKFFSYVLGLAREYDGVFVHMNQEYSILAGWLWMLLGKKVFFWRNHAHGNVWTSLAVWFSDIVFHTSRDAFVAKYKKAIVMPVGVDTSRFKNFKSERLPNSILFFGRMSPIKRPELLLEALSILNKNKVDFVCDFYGDPLPQDEKYYFSLRQSVQAFGLERKVNFFKAVPNHEAPKIYNQHEIFVNLTPAGSFDKTIFEAAACGCLPISSNLSLEYDFNNLQLLDLLVPDPNPVAIAENLQIWLSKSGQAREAVSVELERYVEANHSLRYLIMRLLENIK